VERADTQLAARREGPAKPRETHQSGAPDPSNYCMTYATTALTPTDLGTSKKNGTEAPPENASVRGY
jgi:hypothetical protein